MRGVMNWSVLTALLAVLVTACGGGGSGGPPQGERPGSFTLSVTADCVVLGVRVQLDWTRAQGADSYAVYRDDAIIREALTVMTFVDSLPQAESAGPVYRIRATNSNGERDSNTVTATLPDCDEVPAVPVVDVAAGFSHSLAALEDGTVISWGENHRGVLGRTVVGTYALSGTVSNLEDIVAVAAGASFSLALDKQGRVWAWGHRTFADFFDAGSDFTVEPWQVGFDEPIRGIHAGSQFALAVSTSGKVYSWGHDEAGQLGNGTGALRMEPQAIELLVNVRQVSAGGDFALALLDDGTVMSWGGNFWGQLGQDVTDPQVHFPTLIPDLSGIATVSAGQAHALALDADGRLFTWGSNGSGRLGIPDAGSKSPKPIELESHRFRSVFAGGYQSFGQDLDGRWFAWGFNSEGQFGDGTQMASDIPRLISLAVEPVKLTYGLQHIVALDTEGNAFAWGINNHGQAGSDPVRAVAAPTRADGPTDVQTVASSDRHVLALTTEGQVWAWGEGGSGQLGLGTWGPRIMPMQVTGIPSVQAVAAGSNHSLILAVDRTVWATGHNQSGQLGVPEAGTHSTEFVQVPDLTDIVAIAAGGNTSYAIDVDGAVYAWGANSQSNLPLNNTASAATTPELSPYLTDVIMIASTGVHSLALLVDGSVRAWGSGLDGELGDGHPSKQTRVPVEVLNLTDASNLAVKGFYSHAIQAGRLWTWGRGGIVPTETVDQPFSDLTAMARGRLHGLALQDDRSLYAWGSREFGQVGDGVIDPEAPLVTAVQVLSDVTGVSAGDGHSVAVLADGTVMTWGSNDRGQLGIGTAWFQVFPRQVSY